MLKTLRLTGYRALGNATGDYAPGQRPDRHLRATIETVKIHTFDYKWTEALVEVVFRLYDGSGKTLHTSKQSASVGQLGFGGLPEAFSLATRKLLADPRFANDFMSSENKKTTGP